MFGHMPPSPEDIRRAATVIEDLQQHCKKNLTTHERQREGYGYLRILSDATGRPKQYLSNVMNGADKLRDVAQAIEEGEVKGI